MEGVDEVAVDVADVGVMDTDRLRKHETVVFIKSCSSQLCCAASKV